MKRAVMTTFVLVLYLVLGSNYAHAQSMETSGPAVQQAPSMSEDRSQRAMEGIGVSPQDVLERRHHFMQIMMDLGLNDKQMEEVHNIVDSAAKDLIKKGADIFVARIDMEDIIHREPIDLKAAESKLKQIEAMKTETFMMRLKAFEQIQSVLTADQRNKLRKIVEMHMTGRGTMEDNKAYLDETKSKK